MSLTDKNIASLMEANLVKLGYIKAESEEAANVAVLFQYSIGSGTTKIHSTPDYVYGGTNISSRTSYPQEFRAQILDIEKSKAQGKPVLTWQGEIVSNGLGSNIGALAPIFIEKLMENASEDVTNKPFFDVYMTP